MRIGAVLTVGMLLFACGCDRAGDAAKPDTALYSYLLPDTTFIAGARLSHMRGRPIYQRLLERLPSELRPYEKDASEMVISTDGTNTLILARGKFDKEKLARDLKDSPPVYLSDDLVAIAPAVVIETAKRRAGSELAKRIPSTGDIWAVTSGGVPLPIPERSNLGNLNRVAQDLSLATMSLHVNDGIKAEVHADFKTESSAEQMHTAVKGFIGLGRLSAPQGKPEILRALDAIRTDRQKMRVDLTADWPADLVDVLMRALPTR